MICKWENGVKCVDEDVLGELLGICEGDLWGICVVVVEWVVRFLWDVFVLGIVKVL